MSTPHSTPSPKVVSLSDLQSRLAQRFPGAGVHLARDLAPPAPKPSADLVQKLTLDLFPKNEVSELITTRPGLSLQAFARHKTSPLPLALIDAHHTFHPASYLPQHCARLLWIPCHNALQALQAVDLLLRDGNLPHLLLDLHRISLREEKRIPRALWARLKNQARETGATLITFTPRPLVPTPALRLQDTTEVTLDHLESRRPQLQLTTFRHDHAVRSQTQPQRRRA